MLEIFNNALRNNNYYICMYQNHVYIYHYEEILCFNNETIIIKISDNKIKIKGTNMRIIKMENNELLINGLISGVTYE